MTVTKAVFQITLAKPLDIWLLLNMINSILMLTLKHIINKQSMTLLCLLFFLSPFLSQDMPPYFYYTVTKSDKSLWGICQKYHLTVEVIKEVNKKTDNIIKAGDVLKIPRKKNSADNFTIHMVTKEDKNLWRISRQYQVTVNEIIHLNQKENNSILIGEQLKIPKNGKYLIHIVSKKDKSLWSLSNTYDVSVKDIQDSNKKKNDIIHIGERLIIPNDHQHIPYSKGKLKVTKIEKSSMRFTLEHSPPTSIAYLNVGKTNIEINNDYWDPYIVMGKDVFYLEENYIYKPFSMFVEKTLCELDTYNYYLLSLNRQKWFVMQAYPCRLEDKKSDIHVYYILNLKSRKKTLWCLHSLGKTIPFGDRNSDGNLDAEIEDYSGYKIVKEIPAN